MAERKLKFKNDYYYHVYNRGTDKRKIFMDKVDLYYFFDGIQISNQIDSMASDGRNKRRKDLKKRDKTKSRVG